MSLFDRRLVVVTGKGGVGRSTLTASLAIAAAQRGKRALALELSGTQALPPLFGLPGRSFDYRRATDNVWVSSFTVTECLEDFGRRKLHMSSMLTRVFQTRTATTFIDAIPGLHDLLQLGKVENLIQEPRAGDPEFDIVIIDAPATGHGLTLLSAARSMTDVAKAGPFHDLAGIIDGFLMDPAKTAIAVVTLPEALPVSETKELLDALHNDALHPGAILANRCDPRPLPDHPPADDVVHAVRSLPNGEILADLAVQAMQRWSMQQAALAELAGANRRVPVVQLPRVPSDRMPFLLAPRLAASL